jgi:hypothetical protein
MEEVKWKKISALLACQMHWVSKFLNFCWELIIEEIFKKKKESSSSLQPRRNLNHLEKKK